MATEKTDGLIVAVGAAGGILAAELGKAGQEGHWPEVSTFEYDLWPFGVPKGRLRVAQHGSARLFLRRTQYIFTKGVDSLFLRNHPEIVIPRVSFSARGICTCSSTLRFKCRSLAFARDDSLWGLGVGKRRIAVYTNNENPLISRRATFHSRCSSTGASPWRCWWEEDFATGIGFSKRYGVTRELCWLAVNFREAGFTVCEQGQQMKPG